jgi:chemotaxis methyl-accepting protein methylase
VEALSIRRVSSKIPRTFLRAYLSLNRRIWIRIPASLRVGSLGRAYGRHLHASVLRLAERGQGQGAYGTFFFRNRPELELMCRLLGPVTAGSNLDISVFACSKGAEVYSILWAIRTARPDLTVNVKAVDISSEILGFAERGIYFRNGGETLKAGGPEGAAELADLTWKGQHLSIFERMTNEEVEVMFEVKDHQAKVRSWLREGITWLTADANDPELNRVLGLQDMVVANRFLCHMDPQAAEKCLRNIARLVKPGGYLFVSGVDLEVRTRVARELEWRPVPDLLKEVHEGDHSLRKGWPLEWWGLEPFCRDRSDWKIRYASVFQIGKGS